MSPAGDPPAPSGGVDPQLPALKFEDVELSPVAPRAQGTQTTKRVPSMTQATIDSEMPLPRAASVKDADNDDSGLMRDDSLPIGFRIAEELLSPVETSTSSKFLTPTVTPAEPRAVYRNNNSAVSLPMQATAQDTPSTDWKDSHLGIRTRLPHLVVKNPPAPRIPAAKTLPEAWRQYVRLDGCLYFYNVSESLVTTEDMYNDRLRDIVEKIAHKLAGISASSGIVLPEDWELCVEIEKDEDDEEVLHYNYISHEEGQYFQLGDHKRSFYWGHVEKYCMHHDRPPPFAEADFLSELAYGATERILDNKGTTFRFTGAQTQSLIGAYRELKEAQHEGVPIAPAMTWLFSRTMKLVEETRTNSKYGTADAAAARKPSWGPPTLKFQLIDIFLGFMFSGTHNMYRRRLMKTKFNNVLYLPDFRELLSDMIIEWGDSNLLSTVFVAANVSFLAINDLSIMQRTFCLVSSLFAMISIAGGMHHIWNHRIKLDVEVPEATQFMNHGIIFGERGSVTVLACFLALPIASLLWSFYAFTAALTAFIVQNREIVHFPFLTFMLFVSCMSGITTVLFFWNIWVGWSYNKMVEYIDGEGRQQKALNRKKQNTLGSFFGFGSRKREKGRDVGGFSGA